MSGVNHTWMTNPAAETATRISARNLPTLSSPPRVSAAMLTSLFDEPSPEGAKGDHERDELHLLRMRDELERTTDSHALLFSDAS